MDVKKVKKSDKKVIAVTGTSGFIGSSVLRELEKNHHCGRIIAIDRKNIQFDTKKTTFYRIDLTDTMVDGTIVEILKKEGVDTLIHAAFPATPTHDIGKAHEIQSVGTMHVVNACAAAKVRKFILISTTDVYGAHPENPNFLTEDAELKGGRKSSFIRDKVDAENQVQQFSGKNPEIIVTILRPCTILGTRVKNFKTTFLKRELIATAMGYDPLFQFVHEDDVISAIKEVTENDHPGVFNVVGEGVIPLSKVIQLAGKVGIPLPTPLMYPLAQVLWYLNMSSAPASHIDYLKYICVADGDKARRELGFKPKYNSKGALFSFIGAERLREVNLLKE